MNFDIPVEEEIRILANAMTDAQRKAMFAKMREGGGGGGGASVYKKGEGDMSMFEQDMGGRVLAYSDNMSEEAIQALKEKYPDRIVVSQSESTRMLNDWKDQKIQQYVGVNKSGPVTEDEFHSAMKAFYLGDDVWCPKDQHKYYERYVQMLGNRVEVYDGYLANAAALTDEQRKAIFAKMGGSGGSGGNRTPVYTMGSPTGNVGGTSPRMQYSGPLTVSSVEEIPQETPNYQMGDLLLADGTRVPADKIKDYLGAAYSEQSGVINAGLLSTEQKKQLGLINDPTAGATAVAIQGSGPSAMSTPSQQVRQDIASASAPASTATASTSSPATDGEGHYFGHIQTQIQELDVSPATLGSATEVLTYHHYWDALAKAEGLGV